MKKVNPKDQTAELNRTRLEFLTRNAEKYQELQTQVEQNTKKRDIFTTALTTHAGDDPRTKAAWDFLLRDIPLDQDLKNTLATLETLPATNSADHLLQFIMNGEYQDDVFQMTTETLNEKFLEYLCHHAREVFIELTGGQPTKHLLVGLNLHRTKEAILAEVAELITKHQVRGKKTFKPRLKWLPIADELLAVWDLWVASGKTARQAFPVIARRLQVKTATVKKRWYLAYERIYGKAYETDPAKRREKASGNADALCAKCKDQAGCYKPIKGIFEFLPCPAYLNLMGKQTLREQSYGDMDITAGKQSSRGTRKRPPRIDY